MRRARYNPARSPSRKWSGVSARRGEAERERQEALRKEFGWYGALQHLRIEREAAEAKTTNTTSTEERADNTERRGEGRGQ